MFASLPGLLIDYANAPGLVVTVDSALGRTYSLHGREDLYGSTCTMLTNNVDGTGDLLDIELPRGYTNPFMRLGAERP